MARYTRAGQPSSVCAFWAASFYTFFDALFWQDVTPLATGNSERVVVHPLYLFKRYSMIVELGRFPRLEVVTVSSAFDAVQIDVPTDCMAVLLYERSGSEDIYWATAEDELPSTSAQTTGGGREFRTVPAGQVGGFAGIRTREDEVLWVTAGSGSTHIEVEIYIRF